MTGSRLFCSQRKSMPATEWETKRATSWRTLLVFLGTAACVVSLVQRATASGDAPQWMHALVGATLPSYDEKTNAVVLYSRPTLRFCPRTELGSMFAAFTGSCDRKDEILARWVSTLVRAKKSQVFMAGAFQPRARITR